MIRTAIRVFRPLVLLSVIAVQTDKRKGLPVPLQGGHALRHLSGLKGGRYMVNELG